MGFFARLFGRRQKQHFPGLEDAAEAGLFDIELDDDDLTSLRLIPDLMVRSATASPGPAELRDSATTRMLKEQMAGNLGLLLKLASAVGGVRLEGYAVTAAIQGPVEMAYWASRFWTGRFFEPLLYSESHPEMETAIIETMKNTRVEDFTGSSPPYLHFIANWAEQRAIREPPLDKLRGKPEVLDQFGQHIFVCAKYAMILAHAEHICALNYPDLPGGVMPNHSISP